MTHNLLLVSLKPTSFWLPTYILMQQASHNTKPKHQPSIFWAFWGICFLFSHALFIWIFIKKRQEQMVFVTVENLRRFIMGLWGLSERGADLKKQEDNKWVHMSIFSMLQQHPLQMLEWLESKCSFNCLPIILITNNIIKAVLTTMSA